MKPDVGQRGAGIKLIRSEEQALNYLEQTSTPLVVQLFAEGPHEAGAFYYRFPHESRGNIFAISVSKCKTNGKKLPDPCNLFPL